MALIVLLVVLVALLAGALQQECGSASGGGSTPAGGLGGIAGTGLTRAQIETTRQSPYASDRRTAGTFDSTSYGPPWGGIQGAGISTSAGLRIKGGSPRWYIVAVDPVLVGHGQLVYLWPNPFDWKGPFLAADTGGAIQQYRIDFYDWRGRARQRAWGRRPTTLTLAPHDAGQTAQLAAIAGVGDCAPAAGDESGDALALPGTLGRVTIAPLANAVGKPIRPELLRFIAGVAGIAGRDLIITTGTNHSELTSSGNVSDHVVGLAGDFGSLANHFPLDGGFGTKLAAAGLRAAGVDAETAWRLAAAGGGHNVCHDGWRVQVIWRTGDHHDHVHIGLKHGCSFTGVQTFQI
ncbi:3D domain-containing protein [Solirubrobacter ginsenosidimutans]|uniref:3D domain-containing protein n=1 Tax=Solirubrobacter ginsenosidimutans TaxID=490573 RepID=A0A9X3N5Z6_9ACTN|nr:3D domain-containing protein [Solirubrobacter ginsenosidimutans]MDA0167167.1 3D domain-containing protein [Solirubrobacter ginsenosidimutans]